MPARTIRAVGVGAAALALMLALAQPASPSAQVTQGTFEPLDVDVGVSGHAKMVRTAEGRTKISAQVRGLDPGRAYPAHVHNQACDDGRGGGHYQDQVGGEPAPPNELWLSSTRADPTAGLVANGAGNATGHGTAPWVARPEAQSVVIHLWSDPAVRIACADLA